MTRKRFVRYVVLPCAFLCALVMFNPLSSIAHASNDPIPDQKAIEQFLDLGTAVDYLIIPRIKVNAPVDLVDTNADGSMAVPTTNPWVDVGWYESGPYPGEQGSAVIDGHLDRPGGFPAVFWNLRQLKLGDQVQYNAPGQPLLRFEVTKVAFYKPAQAPIEDIFNNTNGHFLNLITCAGTWIPAIHQTTLRLVVYTSLVTSPHA